MSFVQTDRELTRLSYYAATTPDMAAFAPLPPGDHDCDVAVVGGGLAGLSAAIELRQRGFGVTLLEALRIGHGASGRNGGQAIYGLACDITTIEDQLGRDAARQVFAMSIEALDLIRERIARFRYRLRLARRLPRRGQERAQGACAARRGRVAGIALRPSPDLDRAAQLAAMDRQPALCGRGARPALGPSAPTEVRARARPRGGPSRCRAARGQRGHGLAPGCRRRLREHTTTAPPCAPAMSCWLAMSISMRCRRRWHRR